ncbi:MAG: hypothetical protein AAEJ53_10785 [Myxococcota bacterium]
MADAGSALRDFVAAEISAPAPAGAVQLAAAIRDRHGEAVAAVLFYGSCLRRRTSEGVLDFYVLVDDYRACYGRGTLACLNALLPPNVFHLEVSTPQGELACKYAVLSLRDFARASGPSSIRPAVWARFCQPSLAVWTRDESARQAVQEGCVASIRTALVRTLPTLPDAGGRQQLRSGDFWPALFADTYASELRTENPRSIRGLYHAAPGRFDRALALGAETLEAEGALTLHWEGAERIVEHPPRALARARRLRRIRWPIARALAIAQLLKSAMTFGDWVPYALWKLERHTGTRIELSERQRRHPFLFAWPEIFRVLRSRALR